MSENGREQSHTERDNNSTLEIMRHVLGEIFAESSVESLLSYKLISKFFHDLISGHEFINMQLKSASNNMKYVICRRAETSNGTEVSMMNDDGELTNIHFPNFLQGAFLRLVSCFNGLIFITCLVPDNELLVFTCNPATHRVHLIPTGSPSTLRPTVGIAYNLENWQYKVFKFFKDLLESEEDSYACEVYESVTLSWRRIKSVKYRPFITPYSSCNDHICVDGTIYWLGCSKEDLKAAASPACIMSVNMNDEKFIAIDFPGATELTQSSFLINLEGRLSLVIVDCPNLCTKCRCGPGMPDYPAQAHLWVAEDLDQSTWFHKTSFKIYVEGISSFKSVVARKSEIFFIIADVENIVHYHIYSVAESSMRVLHLPQNLYDPSRWEWPVAFPFAESLCPCGGDNGVFCLIPTARETEEAQHDGGGCSLE